MSITVTVVSPEKEKVLVELSPESACANSSQLDLVQHFNHGDEFVKIYQRASNVLTHFENSDDHKEKFFIDKINKNALLDFWMSKYDEVYNRFAYDTNNQKFQTLETDQELSIAEMVTRTSWEL